MAVDARLGRAQYQGWHMSDRHCRQCGHPLRINDLLNHHPTTCVEHLLSDRERLGAERDEAHDLLGQCNRLLTDAGHTPGLSAVDAITALIDERDELAADLTSLRGELATICGGPEAPRKRETRNAALLRRLATILGDYEDLLGQYKTEVARLNKAVVTRTEPTETMRLLATELKRTSDALDLYGDHKWKCSISKALRKKERDTGLGRRIEVAIAAPPAHYPPCDCGWREFLDESKERNE